MELGRAASAGNGSFPPAQLRAKVRACNFRRLGCTGCHSPGSKIHAPPLEGLYGRLVPLETKEFVTANDQYIRDSILLPASQITAGYQNLMPSFKGHISEEEIMQLIAYIKSIANKTPEGYSR